MAEAERTCEDILLQISAVQAALSKVSKIILEDHLEHCIIKAIQEGSGQEALEQLKSAIAKIIR